MKIEGYCEIVLDMKIEGYYEIIIDMKIEGCCEIMVNMRIEGYCEFIVGSGHENRGILLICDSGYDLPKICVTTPVKNMFPLSPVTRNSSRNQLRLNVITRRVDRSRTS